MAAARKRLFSGGASSSRAAEFLRLAWSNIRRIIDLSSDDSKQELLNLHQCRSMSSSLGQTLENVEGLVKSLGTRSSDSTRNALQNFYRVSEKAKELVEKCICVDNWCLAAAFQMQNEEAFKEILLETSLCYNIIYDVVKDVNKNGKCFPEDLRLCPVFEAPTADDICQDRSALMNRLQAIVNVTNISRLLARQQHLARHLLKRLIRCSSSTNMEDMDVCGLSLSRDGECSNFVEWGRGEFLGKDVSKTTWLGVDCAQKRFDGADYDVVKKEAGILLSLNHPNIVKFLCCKQDKIDGWVYYIGMERLETSLENIIRRHSHKKKKGPPFILLSAVDILLQIAHGVCYLHDNGIAHRDLKTGNVVVRRIVAEHLEEYFEVKLVDFGLSKTKLTAAKSNTMTCAKIGTPVYMPPEAFQLGKANWFKADVYSFGVMCSVVLSGKDPYEGLRGSELYIKVSGGERPKLPTGIGDDLKDLIEECWHSDRNKRPSIGDICTRLERYRHKVVRGDDLREDQMDLSLKSDSVEFSLSYIRGLMKKRSEERKQGGSNVEHQIPGVVIEDDEWFVGIKDVMQHVNSNGTLHGVLDSDVRYSLGELENGLISDLPKAYGNDEVVYDFSEISNIDGDMFPFYIGVLRHRMV